jgi:hypothetical protein
MASMSRRVRKFLAIVGFALAVGLLLALLVGWLHAGNPYDHTTYNRKIDLVLIGFVMLAGLVFATRIALWCHTRRKTFEGGLCHRCGYDLTGNISGVCPECGTKIGGD